MPQCNITIRLYVYSQYINYVYFKSSTSFKCVYFNPSTSFRCHVQSTRPHINPSAPIVQSTPTGQGFPTPGKIVIRARSPVSVASPLAPWPAAQLPPIRLPLQSCPLPSPHPASPGAVLPGRRKTRLRLVHRDPNKCSSLDLAPVWLVLAGVLGEY